MRIVVSVVALIAACGRIGFDSGHDDASQGSVFETITLPPGGPVTAFAAPAGPVSTLYVLAPRHGVYRSTTGGGSWTECAPPPSLPRWVALAVHPTNGDLVYLGTSTDVVVSDDGCATWRGMGLGRSVGRLVPVGDDVLATAVGLWRWSRGAWSEVPSPMDGTEIVAIAVDASGARIFLGAKNVGVIRSDDGGVSWMTVNTGLGSFDVHNLAVDPSNPDHVFLTTTPGTYRSLDGGASWQASGAGGGWGVAVDPGDPSFVAVSTWWGIRASADGGALFGGDLRDTEMALAGVWNLMFDPSGSGAVFAATERGPFVSHDRGVAWSPLWSGIDAWTISSFAGSSGVTYLATDTGILRSDDRVTWTVETTGFQQVSYLTTLLVPDWGPGWLLAGGRNLVSSMDGGRTFTLRLAPDTVGGGVVVSALAQRGPRVWAGTQSALVHSDDLVAWTSHDLGAPRDVRDLLITDDVPPRIYVATMTGVFRSLDDGVTFEDVSLGLSDPEVRAFARLSDGTLIAGTADGVWTRADLAGGWVRAGLDGERVMDLLVRDDTIVAATDTAVRFSRALGTWQRLPGLEQRHPISLGLGPGGELLVGTEGFGLHRAMFP